MTPEYSAKPLQAGCANAFWRQVHDPKGRAAASRTLAETSPGAASMGSLLGVIKLTPEIVGAPARRCVRRARTPRRRPSPSPGRLREGRS